MSAALLDKVAKKVARMADVFEATAEKVTDPLLKDAMEEATVVLTALAWALGEGADRLDSTAVSELSDLAFAWLSDRRVGIANLTFGDLAAADPSDN